MYVKYLKFEMSLVVISTNISTSTLFVHFIYTSYSLHQVNVVESCAIICIVVVCGDNHTVTPMFQFSHRLVATICSL